MKFYKSFKEITVVLLSDSTKTIKQFRVPNFLPPVLALFLLSCGAYISWIGFDYVKIKARIPRLIHLQKENARQKSQVLHLTRRINELNQKTGEFIEKNSELRFLANLESFDDNSYVIGIVGSGQGLLQPDLYMAKNRNGRFRLTLGSLDDSDNETGTKKFIRIEWALFNRDGKVQNKEEATSTKKVVKIGKKEKIRKHLKAVAIELGIDPRLALGMAKVESGYNHKKVSPKGAVGVLQVTPRLAWQDYKVTREKLFDPEVNIRVGLSWMKHLLKRFDHDLDLSLAAYNAGVSRVIKAGYRIPRIKETRNYVRKVKEAMEDGA